MNCIQARGLLAALIDGELDAVNAAEIESHIAGCAGCKAEYDAQVALKLALREHTPYYRAPDGLKDRILASVGRPRAQARSFAYRPKYMRWDWGLAFAAGVTLTICGALLRPAQPELEREIVSAHVRSMMADHLSDVISSDRHTVKPWFNGKLDYAPPVRDLAAQNFPLLGGRLDYVAQRPVAALVYGHRAHMINVFVWPVSGENVAPSGDTKDGYSVVRWRRSGMFFCAVSDLNLQEMNEFAELQIAADT